MWHGMLSGVLGHGVTHIPLWVRWRQPQARVWPGKGWGRCFLTAPLKTSLRTTQAWGGGHPRPRGGGRPGSLASTGWLWDDLIWQYRGNHRNQYIKTSNLEVFIFCEYALISCVHKEKISSLSMVCKKQSSWYIEQSMKLPYSFTHWKLYICNIVWCICLQNIYLHHQSFTE